MWRYLALLLTLAACGGHGGRVATAMKPVTRRASLRYELRGKPFPLPLVGARVNGQPVLMLVDTGANSHVIAGWFARKLGLPLRKLGDVGTDHVGKPIATYRIDKAEIVLDEWGPLGATTVLATEVPEVIERLGIGGFVSPQRLDEDGDAVMLDLAHGELRAAVWETAKDELGEAGMALVATPEGHTCEENDGPVKGLAYVLPSTVDGHEVRLLVDTGAQHTDVLLASAAGTKLVGRSSSFKEPVYTASGKVTARKLRDAKITTGAYKVVADIDLLAGSSDDACPRDGVLAMDALRTCRLLLGRSRILGQCTQR